MQGSIHAYQKTGPDTLTSRKTFRKAQHLRKAIDFLPPKNEGFRWVTPAFIFHYLPKEGAQAARIGIVASRKVGPSVKRNLGKRWARESFRLSPLARTMPGDIVVILRYSFSQHSYQAFEAFLNNACAKALKYYAPRLNLPEASVNPAFKRT